jgi:hypothetical protein
MRVRLSKGSLSFLILFLGLVFGARELPELLSLADDVSNDGDVIEVVCPEASRSSISHPKKEVGAPAYIDVLTNVPPPNNRIFMQVLHLKAGKNLLKLLSLHRN